MNSPYEHIYLPVRQTQTEKYRYIQRNTILSIIEHIVIELAQQITNSVMQWNKNSPHAVITLKNHKYTLLPFYFSSKKKTKWQHILFCHRCTVMRLIGWMYGTCMPFNMEQRSILIYGERNHAVLLSYTEQKWS